MKIWKISVLAGVVLILTLASVLAAEFLFLAPNAEAINANYDLAGWLWSQNYGWISLSSNNHGDDISDGASYQVKVDNSNVISGWAWSSNVGWVCFGADCVGESAVSSCGSGQTPENSAAWAKINPSNHAIEGWAKVCSLKNNGWIHLRRAVNFAPLSGVAGQACYDCQPHCDEPEMAGDPPAPTGRCSRYAAANFDTCRTCFTRTKFDSQNKPDEQVDSVVGGSEFICSNNNTCVKAFSANGQDYRITCENVNSCQLYGAAANMENGALLGWGWNGFKAEIGGADQDFLGGADQDFLGGAGWTHFDPLYGSGFIVYPWLETNYSSIYSHRDIKQKAGFSGNGNNATYCIFARNIRHVKSENCQEPFISGVDIGSLSGADDTYVNALGKLDVKGLTTIIANGKNKYGQAVVNDWPPDDTDILAGKVYVINTDLTVNNPLSFKNGSRPSENGSGTIVVNGDLTINSDLIYDSNLLDIFGNIKQLASVAWIVKGDVIIGNNVKKVVGAFMVLGGKDSDGNPIACHIDSNSPDDDYPTYAANSCGVFFSGASGASLTVSGLIVARAFDFQRTYAAIARGSEKVIYDGRLIANPPPGLKGLSEGLPVIRDFSF